MRRTLAAGLILFGLGVGVVRVAREPAPPRPSRPAPIFAIDRGTDYVQPNTQVEPDTFAWGKKLVATFQSWRIFEGGAAGLAWATSTDGGTRWRSGTVPLGQYAAASDPVVAFDAAHHTWLIAGLGFSGRLHDIFVSRSTDGLRWSQPISAAADTDEDRDKEWIGCDNATHSPYRGHCYLAYVDTTRWQLGVRTSVDGGLTWSPTLRIQPGVTGPGAVFSGPQPVTRPNGDLVIPYTFFAPINQGGRGAPQEDRIAAVVSHDGGATFTQPIRIAALQVSDDLGDVRAPALPSTAVDAAGKLYVVWMDGRFRSSGDANDIVLSTSSNGAQWSEPMRIPLSFAPTYMIPAIAVDPATSGRKAHVAVAYYSMRMSSGCKVYVPGCYQQIDSWLVQSQDGGATWGKPRKLNGESMRVGWLADTTLGAMLGDYVGVSYVDGKAVPVVALAGPPSAFGYNESIFSCRLREPAPRTPAAISSQCRRPLP